MDANRVAVALSNAEDNPEAVIIAYLTGIEALKSGKEAVLWLTRDAVTLAVPGGASNLWLPDAPSIEELHSEYVGRGGIFYVCPISAHLRDLDDGPWISHAELRGPGALLRYLSEGGLVIDEG